MTSLGFTLWIAGTPAVTRTLTVEYLRPVPLHQTHRITAHIVSREGRALHVTATGTGEGGIARFTASAVFIAVSPEHFAAHGDVSAFGDLLEQFSRRGGLDPSRHDFPQARSHGKTLPSEANSVATEKRPLTRRVHAPPHGAAKQFWMQLWPWPRPVVTRRFRCGRLPSGSASPSARFTAISRRKPTCW